MSLSKSDGNVRIAQFFADRLPAALPKPAHCRQVEATYRFHCRSVVFLRATRSSRWLLSQIFIHARHDFGGIRAGRRADCLRTGNGSFVTPLWGKQRKIAADWLTLPSRPSSLNFGHLRHSLRISSNHQIPSIPLCAVLVETPALEDKLHKLSPRNHSHFGNNSISSINNITQLKYLCSFVIGYGQISTAKSLADILET